MVVSLLTMAKKKNKELKGKLIEYLRKNKVGDAKTTVEDFEDDKVNTYDLEHMLQLVKDAKAEAEENGKHAATAIVDALNELKKNTTRKSNKYDSKFTNNAKNEKLKKELIEHLKTLKIGHATDTVGEFENKDNTCDLKHVLQLVKDTEAQAKQKKAIMQQPR